MGDLNLIEILIYFFNFIITFVLLYLLLYKPISTFLEARNERISKTLIEAETVKKDAENILLQAKAELESTGEKARQLSHEAIEKAALDAEFILDNAQEEAEAMITHTREQIAAERQAALERAFTELVSLAGELASRILSREVSLEDNRNIVDAFFNEQAAQFEATSAEAEDTGKEGNDNQGTADAALTV